MNNSTKKHADDNHLKRDITPFQSFAVAFGFVSIATGIFTSYASMLQNSGPAGIWTWPIVVIGQLMVAFIIGALAARIPLTGYIYQWMSRLTNPILGWIMGWVSFTFLAVVLIAVDYTIASAVLPVVLNYEATFNNTWFITAIVLLLQAALISFSTKLTQKVNGYAVIIQLVGMISLVVLLFIVGFISKEINFANLFSTGNVSSSDYLSFGTLKEVGPWIMGTLIGAFTIVGFESAANLAEETKNPEKVVPKAMWQAVASLGIIGFLFLIAVTALAGDAENISKLSESDTPIADVINTHLGDVVGKILLIMVVISIFSCGLVIMLSGTRLVWAMSRDKRFPGWQIFHKVNTKLLTPLNATIFVMLIGQTILGIFSNNEDALFTLFGSATLLPAMIYLASVLLYIAKRKHLPPSKGFKLGKFENPIIIIALIWLIFELSIFRDSSFEQAWTYIGIMFGIGLIYLIYLLVTRGVKGLDMPDMISIDSVLDNDAESVK